MITKQDDQSLHTTRRAKINATGFGPWRSRGCPIGSSSPNRDRSRRRSERLGACTQRAAKAVCGAGRAGRVGSVEGCGSQATTRGGPARGCGLIANRDGSSVEWRSFDPSGSTKTARGIPGCRAGRAGRVGSVEGCSEPCGSQATTRGGPARGCGLMASRAGCDSEEASCGGPTGGASTPSRPTHRCGWSGWQEELQPARSGAARLLGRPSGAAAGGTR
jgi:hypothetical protein